MTAPPSAPKHRRRRIVVTITVVAVGLCWWFWPRVDQRFVGTWSMSAVGEDSLPTILFGKLSLRSNGSAVISVTEKQSSEATAWCVSNSQLLLGSRASLTRPRWTASILQSVGELVDMRLTAEPMAFEISRIGTNEIHVRGLDIGNELILRRIHE